MKSDLDMQMEARDVDVLLVTGPAFHNPPMYYLTGGAHLTHAELIKVRGQPPVLFYNPMERDEAARTGLVTRNLAEYQTDDLSKLSNGNPNKAQVLRYQRMLSDMGVRTGRLAIYGRIDASRSYTWFTMLQKLMPELTIVGEIDDSPIFSAMTTKDSGEVERIRAMGKITTQVVGRAADFLSSQRVRAGMLVHQDGSPVCIGDVKRLINLWLAEAGAENPEETIFAIGRDAGVPHSSGTPADPLRLGETIVFDIFPCEAGGGYFYDFTRTWCLGYASDAAQALYEDVLAVYQQIMDELEVGAQCQAYQSRTCELFEARGHATLRSDPKIQEGYVHGLGHGIGLNIHERPWFGRNASENDRLDPGVVFTVEPGLYYPSRGLGVRLENTVWVRPDGKMEVLAEFPMDLVLPVRRE